MRARGWVLVAGALAVAVVDPGWARGELTPARQALGTVRVSGSVEAKDDGGEWHPLRAGILLEQTEIRTAADGRTILTLANGDVVAVGGSSSVRIGRGSVPRLALEGGRLGIRVQPSSRLGIETPSGKVALPAFPRVAVTGLSEALVSFDRGNTTVQSFRGDFEATRPGAQPILIAESKSVTLGQPESGAPPAVGEKKTESKDMWAALGLSPGMAAAIGGALAVGGGVGGAAASGAFSDDSSTAADKTAEQGSPFRPIQR